MAHECGYYCEGDIHAVKTFTLREVRDKEEMAEELVGGGFTLQGVKCICTEVIEVRKAHEVDWIPDESWSRGKDCPSYIPYLVLIRVKEIE